MAESPSTDRSETVLCTYRVAPGREADFVALLERHWPALHELGLTTGEPSVVYRGTDEKGGTFFVELFTWAPGAVARAHEHPDVLAIWEPMGQLTEPRGGRPGMEFPHVERVAMPFGG